MLLQLKSLWNLCDFGKFLSRILFANFSGNISGLLNGIYIILQCISELIMQLSEGNTFD